MDSFELELKGSFLEEASQLLDDAEQYFLALEKSHDDRVVIESIFRLAHNFKGSSRAVGFGEMADFSHQMESLLLKIKQGELKVTTEVVNLLLRCNDHLRFTVNELKTNFDAKIDSTELLKEIELRMGECGGVKHAPAEPSATDTEAAAAPGEMAYPSASAFGDEPEPSIPPASAFIESAPATEASAAPNVASEAPVAVASPTPADSAAPVSAAEPVSASTSTAPPSARTAPAPGGASGSSAGGNVSADESIRVSLAKVETLINNVGELVIMQTVLSQHRQHVQNALLKKTIEQFSKITKEIQDISMGLRMVPLKATFHKMQKIVRDTSKVLGKDVDFVLSGEETELDKTVLENLGDPLVHLVRNAVDHGLEMPEDRERAGKPREGKIHLSAFHRGSHIVIEARDDGKGMDANRLREKAIEKGVISPNAVLTEQECYQLVFAPGFSTKTEVSDISGRGVGLDVVKTNVEKILHGEIQIETELGKGTCFRILLPLTLAIIDGMIVTLGEERYVLPLEHVYETLKPTQDDVHYVTGMGDVLSLRGENIPMYRLSSLLSRKAQQQKASWQSIALVVRAGTKPFSILVDDILGQQQVVVKRLSEDIQHIRGFGGGAILGDGRAAVILDLIELANRTQQSGHGAAMTKKEAVA